MALIKCKQCGGVLSTKARACPHCGAPQTHEPAQVAEESAHVADEPQKVEPAQTQDEQQDVQQVAPLAADEVLPTEPSTAEEPETTEPEYEETESGGTAKWWVIGLVAGILISGAVYKFYFMDGTTEPTSVFDTDTVGLASNDTVAEEQQVAEDDTIVHLTPEFIEAVRQYEQLGEFSEGVAPVMRDGEWGYINVKGEVVIPFFKAYYACSFSEGRACVLLDYCSENTGWEFPFIYIDKQGKEICRGTFDLCQAKLAGSDFCCPSFKNGKVVVISDSKNVTYDRQGNLVQIADYEVIDEGEITGKYELFGEDDWSRFGLKDSSGNVVIPAKYNGMLLGLTIDNKDVPYGVVPVYRLSIDDDGEVHKSHTGPDGRTVYYGYADLNGNDTF